MSESVLISHNELGDIFVNDVNENFTEFTQIKEDESEFGASINVVKIPKDVLLKYLLSLVDTQIVLKSK